MPGHPTPDNSLQQLYTLMQRGDLPAAEGLVRQLLESAPNEARWWSWLGLLSALQDCLPAAETAYGKAVALNPNAAADWDNLGVAHRRQGRPAEAEICSRRAIALDDSNADHWINLAGALFDQERWEEAGDKYREGLARNPDDSVAWDELAVAELHLGHFATAQEAYERSLAIAPGNVETAGRYAALLIQRGQADRALTLLQPLVARSPAVAQLWLMLGNAHWLRTDLPQAEAAYRQAIALEPKYRVARHNLALVLLNQSPCAETESHVRQLLADDPNDPDEWTLLGAILQSTARIDESIIAFRRSVELKANAFNHSRLLLGLQYAEKITPQQLLTEHQAWAAAYAPQIDAGPAPARSPSSENKLLRIGFASSDFGLHPTGFLVLGALEHLPRDECSVICYSDRLVADEYTSRFQSAATIWRPAAGLSDQEFADLIRKDEIDILVDLMGHGGNRLLVFARQPAPVQVTWFGYVGTTGLPAMDFLLADRFHVPEGEERWYTESILRLPNGYACYTPPRDAPPVAALPARANGHATFGCFNNPAKYTPGLLDAWSQILQKASSARLLLKYNGLDQSDLQRWVQSQFSERGVDPARILFEGRSPHLELLAAYSRIDLALDTQPYSGGLTTCEALWMGVPVVTCPGKTFAGRHSLSHLTNAGYPEFIAKDMPGYIDLAVSWTHRLDELAALRATTREQVRKSPLGDAPRFAQDLQALLQQAWRSRSTA